MAWNKPNSGEAVSRPLQKRKGFRFSVRGAIAGAIVVVGAGIAAWWLWPEGQMRRDAASAKKGLIKEVTPAAAKEDPKPVQKKYKDMAREEKIAYLEEKYGDKMPEGLKQELYYLKNPPQRRFKAMQQPQNIFKRSSERQIAAMLLAEPGDWFLRQPTFDARFDKDLAAALGEKIEITKDDTDDQRDLKEAVIDVKKSLAEAIGRGEKASELMSENARQMYELGQYRKNLEDQVSAIQRDAKMTDADVKDAVDAANEMLKAKGAKPLRMPNFLLRKVALKRRAKIGNQQENKR